MTRNMGTADRIIRTIIALVVGWLYFTNRIQGTLGLVLMVVAAVFLLTSFVSFCPAYLPFKISTKGKDSA
ncbi:MAG: DUF2892 domain-containing protein [Gemmatimonadota bacterium]|nr:DUF2892 domain-containing protein [Gemmatimonadota bacterium]MDH5196420.1 DUF2892 domain-containing protein [Gemmatimonadota bacterium]